LDYLVQHNLIVEPFLVDTKFLENINKIKDTTIKANLLLQYGLLYKNLYGFSLKIPYTIIFPLNFVCSSKDSCEYIFKNLTSFCSEIYIDKEYKIIKFFSNTPNPKVVVDGICIRSNF